MQRKLLANRDIVSLDTMALGRWDP